MAMGYEKDLTGIEMYAYLPSTYIEDLVSRLLNSMEEIGFIPSRRAEGYALLPMGLSVPTHLRLGVYSDMVTFWVRGAGDIERSAAQLSMETEEFFRVLMKGVEKAADVFNSFQDKGSVKVHIPSKA